MDTNKRNEMNRHTRYVTAIITTIACAFFWTFYAGDTGHPLVIYAVFMVSICQGALVGSFLPSEKKAVWHMFLGICFILLFLGVTLWGGQMIMRLN